MSFKEYVQLSEGINDPAIFKVVFLAGGPGSGKSFIVGRTALASLGFVTVNSDIAFEHLMKKLGLNFKMPESEKEQRDMAREAAKATTDKKLDLALSGRLGLVIDGTGRDFDKIQKMKVKLGEKGYESAMIFVNTDLETALARNAKRARSVPEDIAKTLWKEVQNNIGKFQQSFGANFFLIDNSEGSNYDSQVQTVYKKVSTWSKTAANNKMAKQWISGEKEKRGLKESKELIEYRIKDSHKEECDQLRMDGYEYAKSGGECHPAYSQLYSQTVNKYANVPLQNRVHFSNAWVNGFKDYVNSKKDEDDSSEMNESMGIWSYNEASGLWKHEREVSNETADKWMKIYKSDEPKKSFVVSSKKPKGKPKVEVSEAKKMEDDDPCWDDYEMVGFKKKNGKKVPNCVPKNESLDEALTPKHIEALKSEWSKIDKIDPASEHWKATHKKLDGMDDKSLEKIASGGIKFLSMTAATKLRKRKSMKEEVSPEDKGEYDFEGAMTITQLKTICRNAEELMNMLKADENLPEWVQAKIVKAEDYMSSVRDYLVSRKELDESEDSIELDEGTLLLKKKDLAKYFSEAVRSYIENNADDREFLDGLSKLLRKSLQVSPQRDTGSTYKIS